MDIIKLIIARTYILSYAYRPWSLSSIEILSTLVRVAYSSLCPLLLAGRSLLDCGAPGNPRYEFIINYSV